MNEAPYHWAHGPVADPVLLCLHGIGSCADAFVTQIPAAARAGRRLVAWDAPGYRHSADPDPGPGDDGPGVDGWADAAAALLDHLGADRADVLGVSWGGVIATRMALRHPGRVRSLILADSSPGSGTSPASASAMRARAGALSDVGAETFARERAPLLVNREADAELVESVARMMVDSVRMPSYRWACNSLADADHRTDLASIAAPTLVVVGEEDRITGVEAAERLAEGIPGAELVVVPRAGHLANQERPEAVNAALVDFLAGVPA